MKLSIEQIVGIAAGLRALDGYDRVVRDGDRERVVKEFYKLGAGLRLLIAKWQNRLDIVQADYLRARTDLVLSTADGKAEVPAERMGAFLLDERKILAEEEEIDLAPLKVEELKLEQNPIPATVLSLIQPILAD